MAFIQAYHMLVLVALQDFEFLVDLKYASHTLGDVLFLNNLFQLQSS